MSNPLMRKAMFAPIESDEVQRLQQVEALARTVVRFGPLSLEAKEALDEIARLCPDLPPLHEQIQPIVSALRTALGKPLRMRGPGTADSQCLAEVLPRDQAGHVTEKGRQAARDAGAALGIALCAEDLWEEAAKRLRDLRRAR